LENKQSISMSEQKQLQILKSQLADVLSNPASTDYDAIVKLSAKIALLDPDHVRFTSDAAMVRRLGRELVAKQETALAELVKNAYDADATHCSVSLIDQGLNRSLQIIDNGAGMTREQLVNGFMRLASNEKVQHPVSPRYGRKRAGKKGIGRFAAERLGQRLEILTQTEQTEQAYRLNIDWRAFVQGEDLSTIKNKIELVPCLPNPGTHLYIEGLADSWSDAELRRVFRYVLTLQQPFDLDDRSLAEGTDPGFIVTFKREDALLDLSYDVATTESEVLKMALATIDGRIDENGQAFWSLSAPRLGLELSDELIGLDRDRRQPLTHARNVNLRAYYFIYSRDLLGRSTSIISEFVRDNGGIKLYRNGYRVPPYGERDDDWLGLDEAYARRSILAPIANRNFLGAVAIDDPDGHLFEETSSRERLIENDAFREMRSIVSAILITAGQKIDASRAPSKRAAREEREREKGEKAAHAAATAQAVVDQLVQGDNGADKASSERRKAGEVIGEALKLGVEVARERDSLLEELSFLRILASMGLTVAEFTHDFSALAQTIELNLEELAPAVPEAATSTIDRLRRQFGLTRAYAGYFGSMMTSNASRVLEPVDLYQVATEFSDSMRAMMIRRGYALRVERPQEYDIYTVPMHTSEWSAILLNLLTNSIKAANRAGRPGKFMIRAGFEDAGRVYLDFCDNGDGIPQELRARIFDPFFTTSAAPHARASDAVHALGTGLGLKIVADTVYAVDGSVEVIDPPEEYVTCVRITVPAGAPPEVEQ
jgi:signal transduction histidine kinase